MSRVSLSGLIIPGGSGQPGRGCSLVVELPAGEW